MNHWDRETYSLKLEYNKEQGEQNGDNWQGREYFSVKWRRLLHELWSVLFPIVKDYKYGDL